MSLRIPDLADRLRRNDPFLNPLDIEIMGEKASSLGHHGRQVEKVLAALKAHAGDPESRLELVRHAAREVWAFFVQRELCGLRDQREVIRFYGIPTEVLNRLGAMEKKR
jgi:hypothetical protein